MLTPYVKDSDFVLFHGEAESTVRQLEPASIDAIITSPPYADARPDVAAVSCVEFPRWFGQISGDLRHVLKPHGSMMLNLGRRFQDGVEVDYLERTLALLANYGWFRIDTLIWWKPNAPARSGPYLTNAHEYVYWLSLSPDAYRGLDDARAPYAASTLGRYGRNWARNTRVKGSHAQQTGRTPHPLGSRPTSVLIETVGREKGNPHPSPMPENIAADLVALACPPGGTVLDPFAGSGNTLRAARALGRRSVGIEREQEWCELIAERMGQLSLLAP